MPKSDLNLVSEDERQYAPVAHRIALFYARYPEGRIITRLISRSEQEVTFQALVYRGLDDRHAAATGWASERPGDGDVNAVACLENTETSAIGRALANLGFTAARQRPSAEEMAKAARERGRRVHEGGTHPAPDIRALAARDVRALLDVAHRAGLDSARVELLRAKIDAGLFTARQLERLERALRSWLGDAVQPARQQE